MDGPVAQIEKRGRWNYNIIILDDLIEYGPGVGGVLLGWTRYTRKSAEKKARRELARYQQFHHGERWEISE